MKERPILFSAPMVRALLDGSKTQTRRAFSAGMVKTMGYAAEAGEVSYFIDQGFLEPNDASYVVDFCPYGQPGDRLWVREAYADIGCRLTYRADEDDGAHCKVKKWTPSIHMFRADSRILLEVVSVRVERLSACSKEDAVAEGIDRVENNYGNGPAYCNYRAADLDDTAEWFNDPVNSYKTLWESINGAGSWDANPWCWAITFKRVMP